MKTVKKKTIGVLMGGLSSEREVSLASGKAIMDALKEKGYTAIGIDVDRDVANRLRETGIDTAFNALHGTYGEDGAIQGMLEIMGIPYTGSGILASALSMNKAVAKLLFAAQGLLVGSYVALSREAWTPSKAMPGTAGFPVVVKPCSEGSSVGITVVSGQSELESAVELAFRYGNEILIEEYIQGKEVQVGILGDKALGAIEIVPKERFYDYRAKYEEGRSDHFFPARIADDVYQRTLEAGLAAHRALGCRGYSRVDFLVDERGHPYILEVNTLPGMTSTSLLPEIAKGVGMEFPDLIEEILRLATIEHE